MGRAGAFVPHPDGRTSRRVCGEGAPALLRWAMPMRGWSRAAMRPVRPGHRPRSARPTDRAMSRRAAGRREGRRRDPAPASVPLDDGRAGAAPSDRGGGGFAAAVRSCGATRPGNLRKRACEPCQTPRDA